MRDRKEDHGGGSLTVPDAEARRLWEQTGLDTPVVLQTVHVCGRLTFCAGANALNVPGSTVARLKLKEIDGAPHKRWSMVHPMQREEPYQALTCISKLVKASESRKGNLHSAAWSSARVEMLSPATSATPVNCCHRAVTEHSVQTAPL